MEELEYTQPPFRRYAAILIALWTVIFVLSIGFIASETQVNAKHQAFIRAKAIAERDMLYRQWVAGFGGIYVPVNDDVQPNPLLSFIHDRDVETNDGVRLTLVSPASMTLQVYRLSNSKNDFINRLTSLDLMNPDNAADNWEKLAFKQLERFGGEDYSALSLTKGSGMHGPSYRCAPKRRASNATSTRVTRSGISVAASA